MVYFLIRPILNLVLSFIKPLVLLGLVVFALHTLGIIDVQSIVYEQIIQHLNPIN